MQCGNHRKQENLLWMTRVSIWAQNTKKIRIYQLAEKVYHNTWLLENMHKKLVPWFVALKFFNSPSAIFTLMGADESIVYVWRTYFCIALCARLRTVNRWRILGINPYDIWQWNRFCENAWNEFGSSSKV